MTYSLLLSYEIQNKQNGKTLVLFKGDSVYRSILERALPNKRLSRIFNDDYSSYDWGTYVYDTDTSLQTKIESLLRLFQQHIYIHDDDLTEVFALDFHMQPGGQLRTSTGELVYRAKPYSKPAAKKHFDNARTLAEKLCEFIRSHSTYASADAVIAQDLRIKSKRLLKKR